MHNNIMAASSRDRPPMLAIGRYAQWRSRFLRYIDTRPNGDALRKCILEAHEMWEAIERLQQGETLNIQDVKTNLFWEFVKFTSHDGESMESYYSWFYKLMNEMIRNNLIVATKQVNQYQKEVNEICAERIAKNANPLALVATAQPYQDPYYQAPKSHKSYAPTSKASLPTRSHATTRNKGKEIAKPITPPSESASEEDSDPEQAQKDKEMQKNLALIAKYFKKIYKPTNNNLRTSSNTKNKNVDTTPRYKNDNQTRQFGNQRTMTVAGARETVGGQVVQQSGIQCFNCKEFGHFAKECRKPKRVKDSTYHKEKMLLCKQAEKGVPLQVEQSDWLADTDEEIDEQELEAHYIYMAKIHDVPTADSGTYSEPLEQNDQNVVECDDERVALANLIANLKLDVDENKWIQKQLKKANTTLAHELTECKSILAETNRTLEESNSIRDSRLVALQNKQTELEKYKTFNDRTVDYEKLEHKLNETLGLLAQKDIDIKEGLKLKAYEISVVKEKHDELVKQSLLTKSHYKGLVKDKTKIPHDQSDPANNLITDREETLTLERESREKLNKDLVKPYDYTKELVDQAWVKHSKDHFRAPIAHDMEILIKTRLMPLALKIRSHITAIMERSNPYYQALKSHKSCAPPSKHSSSIKSNASTKYKGKEIVKPITPPSESASEEDSNPEQAQRVKDINKNVDTSLRYKNDNQTGQFGNQRTVTVAGARETVVQQTGI
ncbi:reverse transcriptase domain-containing protein [Tanacetum coccineum]